MREIDVVKSEILKQFNNRPNHLKEKEIDFAKNKDVLEIIAKTYLYYVKKFKDVEIDSSKLASAERFTKALERPDAPKTIADLYLDRLLLNLHEIMNINDASDKTKGSVINGLLTLNKVVMNQQMELWREKLAKNLFSSQDKKMIQMREKDIIKNLNDKIVAHELSHLSARHAIVGNPGFSEGSRKIDANAYTYSLFLEEICAEITALNVTGQKIISKSRTTVNNGDFLEIGGYNPESSNYIMSSFVELAPFAFGMTELESQRLINPDEYIMSLNKKYSKYANGEINFAYRIQGDFDRIKDRRNTKETRLKTLQILQTDFLNIALERIKNTNYKSVSQLQQDMGCFLRIEPLLLKYYEHGKDKPTITENIKVYEEFRGLFEQIFNKLKSNNMFKKDYSFEDFLNEGKNAIENKKRKSIGYENLVESQLNLLK